MQFPAFARERLDPGLKQFFNKHKLLCWVLYFAVTVICNDMHLNCKGVEFPVAAVWRNKDSYNKAPLTNPPLLRIKFQIGLLQCFGSTGLPSSPYQLKPYKQRQQHAHLLVPGKRRRSKIGVGQEMKLVWIDCREILCTSSKPPYWKVPPQTHS